VPEGVWLKVVPVMALAAIVVVMGVYVEPFLLVSTQAAEQLLNREDYIRHVLGEP
jgi:formate hydrogenlyase subunit 3/multisubunit Na+/H+ antiporter MnhD subunit